ncbi:MAG: hypothetical protein KG003_07495, partial [Bacteroidetes bacterium]|nr:hypothetical protein [Bacteroidota bacterium]
GILNKDLNGDFPTWEEYAYEEAYHSLRHTAFMNVKKTGGKGFSNALEMIEYTKKHFENIRTEIDIIDPKLIITGFSWPNLRDAVFPDVVHKDWLNTGYNVFWNMDRSDRIILDFYHPSSRIPETVSYVMLEKMIKLIGI